MKYPHQQIIIEKKDLLIINEQRQNTKKTEQSAWNVNEITIKRV